MHLATDETLMKHGWEREALREQQSDFELQSTQSSLRQRKLEVLMHDSLSVSSVSAVVRRVLH